MLEVGSSAPVWHAARRCGNNNCIEVSVIDGTVLMRDSKGPEGGLLSFGRESWSKFISGVKRGEFGHG